MLATVEGAEDLVDPRDRSAQREIAEMPNLIGRRDHRIPGRDQRRIHRGDGREGTPEKTERAAMSEMRIARKEDRHQLPTSTDPIDSQPAPSTLSTSTTSWRRWKGLASTFG